MTQTQQAVSYFSEEEGYHRLFLLFRKKYESIGRIGGTVKIGEFSEEELDTVARFFGYSVATLRKKGNVSLLKFEEQLSRTRFDEVKLKPLLESYFGEGLVSKKEAKQLKEEAVLSWLREWKERYSEIAFWFDHLEGKTRDTYWIYRLIEKDIFSEQVDVMAKAYESLPNSYERMPLFSQRVTGNPHAFDLNREVGKLWIHLLGVKKGYEKVPTTSEEINELLQQFRLLRDDLMNYATCVNLIGVDSTGVSALWQGAADRCMVRNVPLREMLMVERVYPKRGRDVWIVENSGVCSSLMDQLPEAPIVCTHGQFKLATLMLIDKLVAEGCTLHYSGDFDPEGLAMAQRLNERHSDSVSLWRMSREDYLESGASVELNEERLIKLNAVHLFELQSVVEVMKEQKMAGYQEALMERMMKDIRCSLEKI